MNEIITAQEARRQQYEYEQLVMRERHSRSIQDTLSAVFGWSANA